MMSRSRVLIGAILCAAAAGCNNDPSTPTAATNTTTSTTVPITTPVNVSFAGVVGPGGSMSRTFFAQVPGAARAALSAISPATPLTIGLGIPRADGLGCLLAHSATATNGSTADVAGAVASGTFCVQVFAPTQTSETVNFSVALQHP